MQFPGRKCVATVCLIALLMLTGAVLQSGETAPAATADAAFQATEWKLRIKPGSGDTQPWTYANFNLKNASAAAQSNLAVTLELRDRASGAVHASARKLIPACRAGEAVALQLAVNFAADTAEYRLNIQYPSGGRTRQVWLVGGSETAAPTVADQPAADVDAPAAAVVAAETKPLAAGHWKVEPVKGTKDVKLIGTLENTTGRTVTHVVVTVGLTKKLADGSGDQTVQTETFTLAEPLTASATRTLERLLKDCPAFDGLIASVDFNEPETARSKALGKPTPDSKGEWTEDMTGGAQVEVGFDDVIVQANGVIAMRGKLRNGLARAVQMESIKLEFVMANGQVKKTAADLRGKMPSGTLCSVDLDITGIGDFNQYRYELVFKQ